MVTYNFLDFIHQYIFFSLVEKWENTSQMLGHLIYKDFSMQLLKLRTVICITF